jgi:hypothetical protein
LTTTEGDTVIQRAVIADLGGLADDNAHAVIDKKPPPDGGARMNFHAGEKTRGMRHRAAQPLQSHLPQRIGEIPMPPDRVHARITGHHLPPVAGGGVAFIDAGDVFFQAGEHDGFAEMENEDWMLRIMPVFLKGR